MRKNGCGSGSTALVFGRIILGFLFSSRGNEFWYYRPGTQQPNSQLSSLQVSVGIFHGPPHRGGLFDNQHPTKETFRIYLQCWLTFVLTVDKLSVVEDSTAKIWIFAYSEISQFRAHFREKKLSSGVGALHNSHYHVLQNVQPAGNRILSLVAGTR